MRNYKKHKRARLHLAPILVGIFMVVIIVLGLNVLQSVFSENGDPIIPAISMNNDPNPALTRKGLVFAAPKYSGFFNPLYIGSEIDKEITRLIFDPLVEPDKSGKPQPVLADFEVSNSGKTYTFTLKNTKFSNGDNVTATDLEFTYYVMCDPTYDGPIDVKSLGIAGYDEYASGSAATISGISVINDKKISVTLKKPRPSAIFTLGVSPLSKKYYGADFAKGSLDNVKLLLSRPMGCGQFVFTSFDATRLVLEKSRDYHRGKIALNDVTFLVAAKEDIPALLEKGDVDMDLTATYSGSSLDYPYLIQKIYPSDSYGFLGMNAEEAALQNPLVRRALGFAIDKKALIDAAFGGQGTPLTAPLSSTAYSYPATEYVYDLAQAKTALADAGYEKNSAGVLTKEKKTLSLTYATTVGNSASEALEKQLSAVCEELGIKLKTTFLDYGSLYSHIQNGACDLWFMAAEVSPEPRPYDFFGTDGVYNLFHYSSPAVDSLAERAAEDTALLPDLWKLLETEMPIVPLYQRSLNIYINKRLEGLEFSPFFPVCEGVYRILQ